MVLSCIGDCGSLAQQHVVGSGSSIYPLPASPVLRYIFTYDFIHLPPMAQR